MANSIDDFLSKASPEQREKFESMVKDATSGKQMPVSSNQVESSRYAHDFFIKINGKDVVAYIIFLLWQFFLSGKKVAFL